jgi:hypothetical protein
MVLGLATTTLANNWLNMLRATPFTAPPALYVKLHTADPGVAGATAAAIGSATRVVATLAAASGGSISITGTNPIWTNGGTPETLSHISVWDAVTAGNFLWSAAITTTQAWASGNTFTLTSLTMSLAPLAA